MFLNKRHSPTAKLLYKHVVYSLLFAEDPFQFQSVCELIFDHEDLLGEDKVRYLRSLIQIKEKWATAFAPPIFNSGTHATSRAESVNAQIKTRVTSQSKLTDIFHAMGDLTEKVVNSSQILQRNETKLFINHPLLRDLYQVYTRHSFEFMLQQSMFAHEVRSIHEKDSGKKQKLSNLFGGDDEDESKNDDDFNKPLRQGLPVG